MDVLLLIVVSFFIMIVVFKIFVTWSLGKLSTLPRSRLTAEEIIAASTHSIQVRSEDIEEEYEGLKNYFKSLLQNKKLSRYDILAIKEYLYTHVRQYDKKKFKNDIHAIYTMLMARDLTKKHIYTIANYLESIDDMSAKTE